MDHSLDSDVASLLVADVIGLELRAMASDARVARLTQELRIAREMLSEALRLAHEALAHITQLQAR